MERDLLMLHIGGFLEPKDVSHLEYSQNPLQKCALLRCPEGSIQARRKVFDHLLGLLPLLLARLRGANHLNLGCVTTADPQNGGLPFGLPVNEPQKGVPLQKTCAPIGGLVWWLGLEVRNEGSTFVWVAKNTGGGTWRTTHPTVNMAREHGHG